MLVLSLFTPNCYAEKIMRTHISRFLHDDVKAKGGKYFKKLLAATEIKLPCFYF